MSRPVTGMVRRSPPRLDADPSRVITRLFVPGEEGFDYQASRASLVLARILALDEGEVRRSLDDVVARFENRHRDLHDTFLRHADEVVERLDPSCVLSPARRLLLGATFTSEYAIEGAALCNPSVVAHPDQTGVPAGSLRFVMSVRSIGEGHRSSIGFRTGLVDAVGNVGLDAAPSFATIGQETDAQLFDAAGGARLDGRTATAAARGERTYRVRFPHHTSLSERVLWPAMDAERQGMEDARFVRFTDDDGMVSYYASYTAYDGAHISQQLLQTTDFLSFTSSPMVGSAAANKGLALFPRRIGGRFAALSRSDRESNAITFSDNPHEWDSAERVQEPTCAWEVLQLGNCGSPIETDAGWLVLTHGVGPMRTYCIGALLLDLDDPTRILGQLREPLLGPTPDEQDGYVPNVVYSCGALVHADMLVLPYGISDGAIGFAAASLPALLGALQPPAD